MNDAGPGGECPVWSRAILLATVAGADHQPTALLKSGDTTLLGRLVEQLASLGVDHGAVLTRPEWADAIGAEVAESDLALAVLPSRDVPEDLRTIARLTEDERAAEQHLILASADILTHREALAGLLADPRIGSGILTTSARPPGGWAMRTRSERGRVVSAGSPYHMVRRPSGFFLGVLKVDRGDHAHLANSARALADLATPRISARWEDAFAAKRAAWRRSAVLRSLAPETAPAPEPAETLTDEELAAVPLDDETERLLELRAAVSASDALPLALVGLVRSRAHITNSYLRRLFWARPMSQEAADQATDRLHDYDEDKVLLDSAVKGSDGFFTTFFVSPYSRYIARWAARRGFTPNQVTTFSMVLGVAAAAGFATGSRAGLIAGAVLLQVAFTFDCVDGQLARYSRQFSKLGAWLDSVFDRGKEYLVFAGLAIGATAGFGDDVWALAAAALALQTVRHTVDFSYANSRHQVIATLPTVPLGQPEDRKVSAADAESHFGDEVPSEPAAESHFGDEVPSGSPAARAGWLAIRVSRALERRPWMRWAKKIVVLPIGERFALISLTAAIWQPRVTFVALLVWGSFALAYQLAGKVLRSVAA